MLAKFKSRKFLMSLASFLFVTLSEVLGLDIPSQTYWAIVATAVAYILGEAYVDARKQ